MISLGDNTSNNVSTTKHGLTPKLPNDSTLFLNGIGGYTAPLGTVAPTTPSGTPDIWFKADDSGITVNGSNEPTLIPNNGAFGGNFTLDATSSKRGIIVPSVQNGLASLRTDGSDDYMLMNFTAQTSTAWTFMMACRRRAAGSSQRRLMAMARVGVANDFGTTASVIVYADNGSNTTYNYHRGGTTSVIEVARYSPCIMEVGSDSVISYLGFNGIIGWSIATDTAGIAALNVTDLTVSAGIGGGGGTSPDTWNAMDVFEVLVYFGASALTEAQRSSTRAYLSKKWAIPTLISAA